MSHVTTAPERRALVDQILRRKGIQRADGAIPRRAQFSPCELSFAQQRLWVMAQLKPDSAAYNIPLGLRLRGALDLRAVEFCIRSLIARHETLRTSFAVVDGEPRQIVHETVTPDLPLVDLTALPETARAPAARRLAHADAQRVFDLGRAPLLRTTVLRLADDDHVVLLTMHHILSDGWSMSVLARELTALYAARTTGQRIALPPLPVQYADFAVWQRARCRGPAFDRMVAFWKARLADMPATDVAADRPKPVRRSGRSGSEAVPLPPALAARLRELSRRSGTTLFATWLTALAVWLHRYTGQRDLAVGVPIANRMRTELEGLIGFFVNQLVLRTTVDGQLTFDGALQRVREVTLDAFAHQDVPFDRIVEEIHPDRDAETNPLFQVAFAFHNTPPASLDAPGLEASLFAADTQGTRFDLELHVRDGGERLDATLYYDTDLFERETIVRRIGHLVTLLDNACADRSRPIAELAFLTDAEQRQILAWNATGRAWPPSSVVEMFTAQAARTAAAPAIVALDATWSYRELDDASNRLARWLRRVGAADGALVGIWLGRSRHAIAAMVATLKAGAAYVPIDPGCPPARLGRQLTDAGVTVLLTDSDRVAVTPDGAYAVHAIDAHDAAWLAESSGAVAIAVDPDSLAYVIYTSGSTGQPKGVMVTHGGLLNYLCWARAAYPLVHGGATLFHSSLAFDLTVTSVLLPLACGGAIHVVPDRDALDDLTQAFRASRDLDFVKLTPAHLRALAATLPPAERAGRARAFVVGGEALDAAVLDEWLTHDPALRVYNEYGPTETVVGCCVETLVGGETHTDPVAIGKPISNTRLYVVTPHHQLAPVGIAGELWIGGAGVARGYLAQPDLTAERFVPDPFSHLAGARAYRSGDAARYRADGTLEFLGRRDHQVKVRGYRIEPGEIEGVLARHPGVAAAVVMPLRDPDRGISLAAYVVADDEHVARQERAWLDATSTEHVARWQIVFDDTIVSSGAAADPAANFAGWISSYDGAPIPEREMREWVENTVARIASLRPRRVLEIGCGTGLLLLRVAPHCERTVGTDVSAQALAFLGEQLRRAGPSLAHVALRHQPAHDFGGLEGEAFDVVILNSVVQYFPSLDYLTQVLERAARCLAPGGAIFIGDVRCLPLLEPFHASVQLQQSTPATRADRVRARVRNGVAAEEELVVDPAYFRGLRAQVPALTTAAVLVKRDTGNNELAKYRYDVILRAGDPHPPPAAASLEWHRDAVSLDGLHQQLTVTRPPVLVVRRIPNRRIAADIDALTSLNTAEPWETVADLRRRLETKAAAGIPLDDIWRLETACPDYTVDLSWADCDTQGTVAAVVARKDTDRYAAHRLLDRDAVDTPGRRLATHPMHRTIASQLTPVLSDYLKTTLPDYMIPASLTILPALPIAASGKVDRDALPAPQARRGAHAAADAPRTPAEELLAGIWAEVLGVDRIGRDENFFALGGHSLLATQVVSRVRAVFGVELPLRTVFDAPTIATLGAQVSRAAADAASPVPPLEPAPRDGDLPLSFAQQRLWFLHRLDPQSASYNVPLAVRIRGPLAIAALRRSIEAIVERHEVLRTTFELAGDRPVQRIAPPAPAMLPMVSLESMAEAGRAAAASRLVDRDIERPFDLGSGPVYRITLLRLAADDHIVIVVMHHIVSDAWSMGVMMSELGACYTAFAANAEPVLPPLPVQYADFALWQRRWLSDAVLKQQIAYWREQIGDLIGGGDLFPPRRRGVRPTGRRGFHGTSVSAELSAALRRLSRQHDATVFMTTLAALDVVLHAETGRSQFIVGTNVANRRDARVEGLVGFFINQLPIRADLSGDVAFDALLARVRAATLGAYDHQDLPFDRLVEVLRPARDRGRNPIFQVVVSFEHAPDATMALPDLDAQPFPVDRRQTTADLTVTLTDRPSGLSALFEFDADVFDEAAAARIARKLVTVFDAAVENPRASVRAIVERFAPIDRAVTRTKRQSYKAALQRSLPQRQPGAVR